MSDRKRIIKGIFISLLILIFVIPIIWRLIEQGYPNFEIYKEEWNNETKAYEKINTEIPDVKDLNIEWIYQNCEIISLNCPKKFPIIYINKSEDTFCCFYGLKDKRGTCGKKLISLYKCGEYFVEPR